MAESEVPHETHDEPANALPMDRAEELLDRMGQQFGELASRAGRGFLRAMARAREEAEDIWAEGRSIHEHNRNGHH